MNEDLDKAIKGHLAFGAGKLRNFESICFIVMLLSCGFLPRPPSMSRVGHRQ